MDTAVKSGLMQAPPPETKIVNDNHRVPLTGGDKIEENAPHPLLIDLILDRLFVHLPLEALKCSRLVCSKWEETSRAYLIWKSTICLSKTKGKPTTLKKLQEQFPDHLKWPFRNFRVVGEFLGKDFDDFLNFRGNMRQLKLEKFCIVNKGGQPEPWVWKSNMYSLRQFNYSSYWLQRKSHVTLALSNFHSTQKIILFGEKNLNLILDAKISPQILSILGNIKFWAKDPKSRLHEFSFNDFFHTKQMKRLTFQAENLKIDLTDCSQLEGLSLHTSGQIVGWNDQLNLKELNICCVDFDSMLIPKSLEKLEVTFDMQPEAILDITNFVNLQNLHVLQGGTVVGWNENLILEKLTLESPRGQIDFSILPKTLEFFSIYGYSHENLLVSSPSTTLFLKLRYLYYTGAAHVHLYSFCPSLTDLTVGNCEIDVSSLPKTLKRLILVDRVVIVGSSLAAHVQSVTVKEFYHSPFEWQLIEDVMEKFKPRYLNVHPVFKKTTEEMISQQIVDRMQKSIQKQMETLNGEFYITKIQWKNSIQITASEKEKVFINGGLLPEGLLFQSYEFKGGHGIPVKRNRMITYI